MGRSTLGFRHIGFEGVDETVVGELTREKVAVTGMADVGFTPCCHIELGADFDACPRIFTVVESPFSHRYYLWYYY